MRRFGLKRVIVHNGQLDRAALREATKGQAAIPSADKPEKCTAARAKPSARDPNIDTAVPVSPLSPYELKFIERYMAHSNATEAVLEADGSEERGRTAASTMGGKLLRKVQIRAEIERRKAAIIENIDVNETAILRELACLAFSNMADFTTPGADGAPVIDFRNLSRQQMAAVREVTIEEFKDGRSDKREVRRIKFRLYDKTAPLELLGRHLQMFADKAAGAGVAPGDVISLLLAAIDREGRGMKTISGTVEARKDG